jgi:molybdopterin-guanine dinucleotide biosynthesis protein A
VIRDCTAIILAGGDSRRMGSDKANLQLGEQTMLQRVIAAMQQVFPQVVISVRAPRPGIDLPQVCDDRADPGNPGEAGTLAGGPLAGLVAGLGQIATPWAFVVACDMPFVQPALVEFLARYRGQYQAVVPVIAGHDQPLAAYYAVDCLGAIHAHLAEGGKNSMRALLGRLRVCRVDQAELLHVDPGSGSFFDLDTPQDVEVAKGRC